MKLKLIACTYFIFFSLNTSFGNTVGYKNIKLTTEERVDDLLKRMTLEEKIGQLSQIVLDEKETSTNADIKEGKIGSFCVVKQHLPSVEKRNELQRLAVDDSRLGIPLLFAFDVIHGFNTIFPIPLATSSSWDTDLTRRTAVVAAEEAKAAGMDMTFSPMVDVARDPRWGRISEGYGEDVLLNARFGQAMIEGYQQIGENGYPQIGACIKHFVGYGAAEGGRDYQFTEISERTLREVYLPPFEQGIRSGAMSVMSAFNDISGVPASANAFTLNKILKDEWKFDGFALSDWDAVEELIKHGIVGNKDAAALEAIRSGLDMEMKSNCYASLVGAVKEKKISENIINEAVKRVLRIKFRLGLFDYPYVKEQHIVTDERQIEKKALARQSAAESMVLLKNNGILPLSDAKTISLLGDWVHNRDVYGWWTGNGNYADVVTVWDGMSRNVPEGVRLISGTEARQIANVSIVCVGEPANLFGESNSRTSLEIPLGALETVKELKELGGKVVVVVFSGRPLVLTELEKYADAILLAWHPGCEAGNALADILFGNVNPSGKITCSFPKHEGQIPIYYSERTSGRPEMGDYKTIEHKPLYPFGYGLSYTTFKYSNLKLSSKKMKKNETLEITVDVTNTGKTSGKEVVQLYVHDKIASVTRPKKELKDFKKVEIKSGETKNVKLTISGKQLQLLNKEKDWILEPGDFDIWVGGDSQTGLYETFSVD